MATSKATASSNEMLERALGGETLRQIAAEVGVSTQAVWGRIHRAAAAAHRTDEFEAAIRRRRRLPKRIPRSRDLLAAVARAGSVSAVATELRVSEQTIKNRLSAFYRARGYHSGMQAMWHEFVSLEGDRLAAAPLRRIMSQSHRSKRV